MNEGIVPYIPRDILKGSELPAPGRLNLDQLLAYTYSLRFPRNSLVFGMAYDHKPVGINWEAARPNPMIIYGDQGAGKTALLKIMARSSGLVYPDSSQWTIVTPDQYDQEWTQLGHSMPNYRGIYDTDPMELKHFLNRFKDLDGPQTYDPYLVLFDGLEHISGLDKESQANFWKLLVYGPARRVFPIVTLNPQSEGMVTGWEKFFKTGIFGKNNSKSGLRKLASEQFIFHRERNFVNFWLPSLY